MDDSTMRDGTPNDWRATNASRHTPFPIDLDGEKVDAYPGETVSGLLWRLAQPVCRWTDHQAEPRGYFCGMGVCFECLVIVNDVWGVRACMERLRPGTRIRRIRGPRNMHEESR